MQFFRAELADIRSVIKRVSQWSFLFSLSLVIALVVGEIALRLYDSVKGVTAPYTHNLPECLAVPNGYYNYGLEPDISVKFDSQNPRTVTINRWGFRGGDLDPIKPEGVKRIFCVGGSSTFDPYVSDAESWPALLGKKLNAKLADSIECVNAGRYGFTTSEILGLLHHRILRFDPDLIILYSTYNDSRKISSPYYGADDFPQLYGNPSLSTLNKNSALFAFLDFRMRHVWKVDWYLRLLPSNSYSVQKPEEHLQFLQDESAAMEFNVGEFNRNLRAMELILKEADVPILLCTQLIDTTGADASPVYNRMVAELTESVKLIAKNDSLPVLDFQSSNIDQVLQTYVHFTPTGSHVFSDSLAGIILRDKLINK